MSQLHEHLTALLERCKATLIDAEPTPIAHNGIDDLRNSKLPESLGSSAINLYALWSRPEGTENWSLQYIGQRTATKCCSRLREHLFHKPDKTQSKLDLVKEALRQGHELGVTTTLVEPDYLRLSIEDELIRQTTLTHALPWNKRSRSKIRSTGPNRSFKPKPLRGSA